MVNLQKKAEVIYSMLRCLVYTKENVISIPMRYIYNSIEIIFNMKSTYIKGSKYKIYIQTTFTLRGRMQPDKSLEWEKKHGKVRRKYIKCQSTDSIIIGKH